MDKRLIIIGILAMLILALGCNSYESCRDDCYSLHQCSYQINPVSSDYVFCQNKTLNTSDIIQLCFDQCRG